MSEQDTEGSASSILWQQKTIGEIARIQGGEAKATNQLAEKAAKELAEKAADELAVTTNSYPYIQSGDLQDTRNIAITRRILKSDAAKFRRVKDECVLLAAARPETVGRCGILSEEAIINNVTQALIPDPAQVLIDFLFYYFCLPSTRKTLVSILLNKGRTQLRHEDTENLPISLPDLNTQRRIVRRLNTLIAEVHRNKSTLERIRPHIAQTKAANIDKIFTALEQDQSIDHLPLRDIVTLVEAKPSSKEDIEEGWRELDYIPLNGLGMGTLLSEEVKPLHESLPATFYKSTLPSSTILYALIDPSRKRVALLKNTGDITYNRHIAALRVTNSLCNPTFCMWALIAAPLERYAHGANLLQINRTDLLQYPLPLPSLDEQKRIVDNLDALDKTLSELLKKQTEQMQKTKELEQAIITQALQGA